MKRNKIHFIGICGVAMSALALAFKKQGWTVTGSDVGFYPPISTYLKDNNVEYYPGWHPELVLRSFSEEGKDGNIVVVGNVASSTNPEWLYVQEHKLNYKSYPELVKDFFVKKNSIVCAGTYGKTSSTALTTWILKEAGFDPSYMIGGLMATSVGAVHESPLQHTGGIGAWHAMPLPTGVQHIEPLHQGEATSPLPSANISDTDWSVLEGDEYKTSRWDNGPKFAHYSPTHLLLSSIVWDHPDVYPTEKEYFDVFKKLVMMLPQNGTLVMSEQAASIVIPTSQEESSSLTKNETRSLVGHEASLGMTKPIIYGPSPKSDYSNSGIAQTTEGITFTITEKVSGIKYQVSSICLGDYMADNITGCFALCRAIGIEPEKIIAAVKTFPGLKRRLEKRFEGNVTVFDDIAHSPTKAKSTLASVRKAYTGKVIAIFEPNTGNRKPQAVPWYDNAFDDADLVVIPRLTEIKKDPNEPEPMHGEDLQKIISKTHSNVRYSSDDTELVKNILNEVHSGDVVVFMGSHGFRGMIEQLISKLGL